MRPQVSGTLTPSRTSGRGESTRPFSNTFCLRALKPPGTVPPMSSWWAFSVTNATIAPSRNTGRVNTRSLLWLPVRYGSFAMSTSPGRNRSRPYSATMFGTASMVVPAMSTMPLLAAGTG